VTQLVNQKADYEEQLRELEERLAEAEANNEEMSANNKQLDEKIENMKKVRYHSSSAQLFHSLPFYRYVY